MEIASIKIREPLTLQEFEAYFLLRFRLLRKPWNQPVGSEKDTIEDRCIHCIALQDEDIVIGVGRLQFNSNKTAQVRYMAIEEPYRGNGVGKKILEYLEKKAKENYATEIILDARENAVAFYQACGYSIVSQSYLLFEKIQHFLMKKII